jgi:hypothetical protein
MIDGTSSDYWKLGVMNALRVLARLVLAFLLANVVLGAGLYLINAPGLIHTWIPLVPFVLLWVLIFWLLGRIPFLTLQPRTLTRAKAVVRCASCSGEISFDAASCPHCGARFGTVTS